jgi:hypothetical protein
MVLEDLAEVTSGTLTSLGYGSPGDIGAGQIKDLRLAKTARKRRRKGTSKRNDACQSFEHFRG